MEGICSPFTTGNKSLGMKRQAAIAYVSLHMTAAVFTLGAEIVRVALAVVELLVTTVGRMGSSTVI